MTKLELIKSYMEDNLNDFKEMQQRQLKEFEEILNSDIGIDELDAKLDEMNQEFRFSTEMADVACDYKTNFKRLHDYTWDMKAGVTNA